MQFQADLLGCAIVRPKIVESTALGAARLAGITVGLWKKKDLARLYRTERVFKPKMNSRKREELYKGWMAAVGRVQQ
jgi:glycerol kinase